METQIFYSIFKKGRNHGVLYYEYDMTGRVRHCRKGIFTCILVVC